MDLDVGELTGPEGQEATLCSSCVPYQFLSWPGVGECRGREEVSLHDLGWVLSGPSGGRSLDNRSHLYLFIF